MVVNTLPRMFFTTNNSLWHDLQKTKNISQIVFIKNKQAKKLWFFLLISNELLIWALFDYLFASLNLLLQYSFRVFKHLQAYIYVHFWFFFSCHKQQVILTFQFIWSSFLWLILAELKDKQKFDSEERNGRKKNCVISTLHWVENPMFQLKISSRIGC